MKIKNSLLLLSVLVFLFSECSQDNSVKWVRIDKDQASIELMKELAPQLTGTWTIKQLQIKHQNSTFHGELNIRRDTTLVDFAILTLARASLQVNPTRDRYVGSIQYGSKTYPVAFDLLAGPWIFDKKGPKAYLLLEYNFPIGYNQPTEKEEYFLQQIGLLLETFSLETTSSEPTMTWYGLNRGIDRINFVKK